MTTRSAPSTTDAGAQQPPGPPAELSHRQLLVIFSALMLGMLLAALDQTIVATALPPSSATWAASTTSPGW